MDEIAFRLLSLEDIAIAEKFLRDELYPREPSAAHLEIKFDDLWVFDKPTVEVSHRESR